MHKTEIMGFHLWHFLDESMFPSISCLLSTSLLVRHEKPIYRVSQLTVTECIIILLKLSLLSSNNFFMCLGIKVPRNEKAGCFLNHFPTHYLLKWFIETEASFPNDLKSHGSLTLLVTFDKPSESSIDQILNTLVI